jgi:hypothetical protein
MAVILFFCILVIVKKQKKIIENANSPISLQDQAEYTCMELCLSCRSFASDLLTCVNVNPPTSQSVLISGRKSPQPVLPFEIEHWLLASLLTHS